MLSSTELYRIWNERVRTLLPANLRYRRYRHANLFWLFIGIFRAAHIYLTHIVRKIPIRANKLSLSRRFRRFLDNDVVNARAWYEPTMQALLQSAARSGHVRLLIDCTTVGRKHLMMMGAVAYRRRALPIAWSWVPIPNGNGRSTEADQIELLRYIRTHLPENVLVSLVGDTEFGGSELIRQLRAWDWGYVLHQKENTYFFRRGDFYQFMDVPTTPGDLYWFQQVDLFKSRAIPSNVLVHHGTGYKEPLYLTINFSDPYMALTAYSRRMWIELLFADFKQNGFHLWHSRLETPERLSRLTMLVCLLYLWLVGMGQHVLNNDLTDEVDRSDRRDLSLFRLG
jgi:hypothetical protein